MVYFSGSNQTQIEKKVGIRILLKVFNEYRPKGSTLDLDLDRP